MFAILCDAAVILALYAVGRHVWELWVFGIVLIMAAVNVMGPGVLGMEVYQIALEAMNAIALLTIGGVGSFQLAQQTDGIAFHHVRHIFGFGFAVRGQDYPHHK